MNQKQYLKYKIDIHQQNLTEGKIKYKFRNYFFTSVLKKWQKDGNDLSVLL